MTLALEISGARSPAKPEPFEAHKSKPRGKSTERREWRTLAMDEIEAERRRYGMTRAELCRRAGIHESTFRENLSNPARTPQRRILVKLSRALGVSEKPVPEIVRGLYRAAVTVFAQEIGANVTLALAPVVSLSNLDENNRRAGKARRLAFYLTVNAFELQRREIADMVGYSKQAASKALKEIEDQRDGDAAMNAAINRVAKLLTGSELT